MSRRSAAAGSALFLALAPGVIAGLGPWLVTGWHMRGSLTAVSWTSIPLRTIGAALIAGGAVVVLGAFARFVTEGVGTPAPVAPTEQLVIGGLYRYVRNPMYVAVTATILGQALLLGQPALLLYAAAFLAVTAAFVHWYEEPTLRRRYGTRYDDYLREVPGWWPRLRQSSKS